MEWTKKESDAINDLITGFGRIKRLPDESKDKLFDICLAFHMKAFDIEEKRVPKGMIV